MAERCVFVTGAGAGIGRAIVRRFLAGGWHVGAIDLDAAGLAELAEAPGAGDRLWTATADVTDAANLERALAGFMEITGGRLDLLVNNAGLVAAGDFESVGLDRYDRLVDVNVKGVVNGCHLALPWLMHTPGARVINMCSASAAYGSASFATYSATKFAVRGLTEALDIEWHRHDIRVMAVWPLFVNTAMVSGIDPQPATEKLGVRLEPDDVARVVWSAATYPDWVCPVHWMVGAQGWLLVNLMRFLPARLNRLIGRIVYGY